MRQLLRAVVSGVASAGFLSIASIAGAQSPNMQPFDLNMDRVSSKSFGGKFSDSRTYFLPSYDLLVSVNGSVWAKKGGAQAHGKFFVDGLEPAMMRGLAAKLQADLAAKLKAAGYTVLTYEDLKGDPEVAGRKTESEEDKWGFPVKKIDPLHYILVAPTPAQQFDYPIQGPAWPWKSLAKDKDLVTLTPQLRFSVPQMWGEGSGSYTQNEAGINTNPAMIWEGATVWSITRKGGGTTLTVQRHGQRLASENAGKITKLSEDRTNFSAAWKRVSGDYSFEIDPVAFTDGIMRVGLAFNAMLVAEIDKAHK